MRAWCIPDWNRFTVAGGADIGRDGNVVAEVVHDPGDLDEAFAAADVVVEGTYRTPPAVPSALGTQDGARHLRIGPLHHRGVPPVPVPTS